MKTMNFTFLKVDFPIMKKFTARCVLTVAIDMYPIANLISMLVTRGEKQMIVYITNIKTLSLKISLLYLNLV